jgi:hypothetical protein
MSKQSAAKEHQGYTRSPQCGRCVHFKSDNVAMTFGVIPSRRRRTCAAKSEISKLTKPHGAECLNSQPNQTLCVPCHKAKTAKLAKDRSEARRREKKEGA